MTTTGNIASRFLIRVWGDFNDLQGDVMPCGFESFVRFGKGQPVIVADGEGNTMEGVVKRVTSWGFYARMDRSTWKVGPR